MILLRTFAVAALGAVVAWLAGLPLPVLLGPMFACLLAALTGLELRHSAAAGNLMRTVLGVAVGASITPALIGRLPDMAMSVAMVPIFLIVAGGLGYPLFRRQFGFDHATSYYAAMPGGLQDMLVFGEAAGGDVRALSLMHATRVLIIVSAMPVFLTSVFAMDLTKAPGQLAIDTPLTEIAIMLICAVGGWQIAQRAGLFGASILGPMILTAAASLSGLIHFRPPAEAILAAQFFIGLGVGAKYSGITWVEVRHFLTASITYCLIIGAASAIFALLIAGAGLAPLAAALMAFAPGGQAEMAVLAIVAGIDVAYVVAHHLVRLVLVITAAPLIERLMAKE